MGILCWVSALLCCVSFSNFGICSLRKTELIAFFLMHCFLFSVAFIVISLFFAVLCVGLKFVIVSFPCQTDLLFYITKCVKVGFTA